MVSEAGNIDLNVMKPIIYTVLWFVLLLLSEKPLPNPRPQVFVLYVLSLKSVHFTLRVTVLFELMCQTSFFYM